tara:strand:- start:1067 stop:1726 length:660 start_codon:yes stop_codon:yes gene_type:complete
VSKDDGDSIGKRMSMTLYSDAVDHYSHAVRIVVAEKDIGVDLVTDSLSKPSAKILEMSPYGDLPVFADRDLVLYQPLIIMEYLDERFPHPPLMPVYPTLRALNRQWVYRVRRDWSQLVDLIQAPSSSDAEKEHGRMRLRESLMSASPIFEEKPFFMSDEFTLVDCCIASILWRLGTIGIQISKTRSPALAQYAKRLFERPSFQQSLTPQEREFPSGFVS